MSNITLFDVKHDSGYLNGQSKDFTITQKLLQMKFATLVSNNSLREIDDSLGLVFIKLNETDMFVGDASSDAVRALATSNYIMEAHDVDKYGLRLYAQEDFNKITPLTINEVLRLLNYTAVIPLNSLKDIFSGVFVMSVPNGYFTGTVAMPYQLYARLGFDNAGGAALPSATEKYLRWRVLTQRGNWMNNTPLVADSQIGQIRLPAAGVWMVVINVEMTGKTDAIDMKLLVILDGAQVESVIRPQLYTPNDNFNGPLGIGGTFLMNCTKAGNQLRALVEGDFMSQTLQIATTRDPPYQATYRTWMSLCFLG